MPSKHAIKYWARLLLMAVLFHPWFLQGSIEAIAQPATALERPDHLSLRQGDLVWPRNPKAIVPYDSSQEDNAKAMKKQWESERDAFVRKVRADPNANPELLQTATNLDALSYADFSLQYLAGKQKSDIEQFGAVDDLFSVGHVGIIDVAADGQRYVIEAVWGKVKKVQRIPYASWLADRAGSWVWVGRMDGLTDTERSQFVEQAKTYLGRPYDFWNFDLADDSSFYCSKLVWLSLAKSLGRYMDYQASRRSFWFSPKQAWSSPLVHHVNSPRDYLYYWTVPSFPRPPFGSPLAAHHVCGMRPLFY
jgi:hypothetical protein